jgi:hypothetical protein
LSFRRQVLWTLLLQGSGAVAMLAAMTLIGRYLGPAELGHFSRVKAEVEFIGAIAMFGLPQALFYFVQTAKVSRSRARGIAAGAAAVAALTALVYGGWWLPWSNIELAALSLAAAAFVWHGCVRGLALTVAGARHFNVITALPQVLMLVYAVGAAYTGRFALLDVALAFALSFALVGGLGLRGVGGGERSGSVPVEEPLSRVLRFGLAAGLSAVGTTSATLLVVHAVQERFGAAQLGVFTFSLAIAQGILVPLNYTVPLLFKRWMEHPDTSMPLRSGLAAAAVLSALAGLVWLMRVAGWGGAWLGTYESMPDLLWVLMLAAAADACQRIVAVDSNARGAPQLSAMADITRLMVVAAAAFAWPWQSPRDAASIVFAAACSGAVLQVALHRQLVLRKK